MKSYSLHDHIAAYAPMLILMLVSFVKINAAIRPYCLPSSPPRLSLLLHHSGSLIRTLTLRNNRFTVLHHTPLLLITLHSLPICLSPLLPSQSTRLPLPSLSFPTSLSVYPPSNLHVLVLLAPPCVWPCSGGLVGLGQCRQTQGRATCTHHITYRERDM
jgi:hypothetical protein